jgi:hypothetical protein
VCVVLALTPTSATLAKDVVVTLSTMENTGQLRLNDLGISYSMVAALHGQRSSTAYMSS